MSHSSKISISSVGSTKTATEAPWSREIKSLYEENYGSKGMRGKLPLLSSVNGVPQTQRIDFASFSTSDDRVLIFNAKCNNSSLIANCRASAINTIVWEMPKTGHVFNLTGKVYFVAAPSLSHRFGSGPRRITLPEDVTSPEDYWETSRQSVWSSLSTQARATYTWPSSSSPRNLIEGEVESTYSSGSQSPSKVGLHVGIEELGFKFMKLEEIKSTGVVISSSNSGMTKEEELTCVHNAAKDNLCLVVFKVQNAEVIEPASAISPPSRFLYDIGKDGKWRTVEMNP